MFSELEAMAVELTRVVAERDALAAQIKADAITMSDKIQHATKQGTICVIFSSTPKQIEFKLDVFV